jgi:hypothetical protein
VVLQSLLDKVVVENRPRGAGAGRMSLQKFGQLFSDDTRATAGLVGDCNPGLGSWSTARVTLALEDCHSGLMKDMHFSKRTWVPYPSYNYLFVIITCTWTSRPH